jgi:hypothetical protein
VADLAQDAVRADLGADERVTVTFGEIAKQGDDEFGGRALEKLKCIAILEHVRCGDGHLRLTRARPLDVGRALDWWDLERPVDDLEDLSPPGGARCSHRETCLGRERSPTC